MLVVVKWVVVSIVLVLPYRSYCIGLTALFLLYWCYRIGVTAAVLPQRSYHISLGSSAALSHMQESLAGGTGI